MARLTCERDEPPAEGLREWTRACIQVATIGSPFAGFDHDGHCHDSAGTQLAPSTGAAEPEKSIRRTPFGARTTLEPAAVD